MKNSFRILVLFFSLGLLFLLGCKKEEVRDLLDAPTQIEFEGFFLELEAYVWRDFQPGTLNSNMISINTLIDRNFNDISNRFELKLQFVVRKNDIWESVYTSEIYETSNNSIEKISRDGPKWDTGKKVDVICQFRDRITDIVYQILLEDQTIERTD